MNINRRLCDVVDNCPADGICIKICALNCLSINDNREVIVGEECPDCGLCIINCPKEALTKN